MDQAFELEIRQRAYTIWMAEGMSDGDAERHWLSAEDAIRRERAKPSVSIVTAETKPASSGDRKAATKAKPAQTGPSGSVKLAKAGKAEAKPAKTKSAKTIASKVSAPHHAKTTGVEAGA